MEAGRGRSYRIVGGPPVARPGPVRTLPPGPARPADPDLAPRPLERPSGPAGSTVPAAPPDPIPARETAPVRAEIAPARPGGTPPAGWEAIGAVGAGAGLGLGTLGAAAFDGWGWVGAGGATGLLAAWTTIAWMSRER